jgi:hypothetical protein
MTKEFNLSDRIKEWDSKWEEQNKAIDVRDVKEAVRLLKAGIHDFNEMETGDIGRNKFIDKIFGEKLI